MPPESVRRSNRIAKEIAILLVGSDMEGKMFSEQTKTVLLSRHGAGIVSQYALSAEQELILRRLDTNKEAEVRVVGNLGAQGKTRSEEHTSELQSQSNLVCRLLLEKKKPIERGIYDRA